MKTKFYQDCDLKASVGSWSVRGYLDDEFIVSASGRGKSGAARGIAIGERVCRHSDKQVKAWIDWVDCHAPLIWMTLNFKKATGKEAARRELNKFLRVFAGKSFMKRHVLAFIYGDWQRSRRETLGEKSWHFHCALWLEQRHDRPCSQMHLMKWLHDNWRMGDALVQPYNEDKRGVAYALSKHQQFDVEVVCNRPTRCRSKRECQVKGHKIEEVFR